jgi:hypothetical protein
MMKRLLPLLLLAFLAIAGASCNKTENDSLVYEEPTRGFYPLQVGRYVVYDVDSITWNNFDCTKKTRHLQMRYMVADTFTDDAGRPSYRVDVEQRDNPDSAWAASQVFYATPTNTSIEVVMQNLRFEKLIFPIRESKQWFGNRAIDTTEPNLSQYGGWVYRYSDYLKPYNNGRLDFGSTVTVVAVDDSVNNPETMPDAYAERNYFREVYAYAVGMVYREATYWTYDPANPSTACRKGFSVVMRAIQYGG